MALKDFSELPGPWGLPLLGSLLDLKQDQGKNLHEWSERYYGPVFRFKLGTYEYVSLQGKEAVKEALIQKGDSFNGRLESKVIEQLRDGKGVFFTGNGNCWNVWHKFAVEAFPATWETFEKAAISEANEFAQFFSTRINSPVNIHEKLLISMMNPILHTSFSKKYDLEDLKAKELYDLVYDSVVDKNFGKLLYLPYLEYLPSFKKYYEETEEKRKKRTRFLLELLKERRNNYEKSSIDLVTCYDQILQVATKNENMDEEHFAAFIGDLLFAGTATTANQISWILLYLLKNPECMELIQNELTSVFEGKFSLEKLNQLHYTKAVIEETFRLRPIAPTLFLLKTSNDTSIQGYKIPINTPVFVNLFSVHHDKNIWGPDPEDFCPERHLDQFGKFHASDHVIPFSIGQRSCSGKKFAYTEIIAYISTLLLKYKITLANESRNITMKAYGASIKKPQPFKVLLKPIDSHQEQEIGSLCSQNELVGKQRYKFSIPLFGEQNISLNADYLYIIVIFFYFIFMLLAVVISFSLF